MPKAESEASSEAATPMDAELAAADLAIDDAAQYANQAQAAGEVTGEATAIKKQELSSEERRALSRSLARRQRDLGMEEMARVYPSTLVVNTRVTLNDPNIASSAQRFLGLVDRTNHLLTRFGFRFHKEGEVDTIRQALHETIKNYCDEANATFQQGQKLAAQEREKVIDWLTPTYTSHTIDVEFGVKSRDTISIVRALEVWDAAIIEFAALEFNDSASIGQIDTLRQRERVLFYAISKHCFRIIASFSKRRTKLASVRSTGAAAGEKGDKAEAATAEAVAEAA